MRFNLVDSSRVRFSRDLKVQFAGAEVEGQDDIESCLDFRQIDQIAGSRSSVIPSDPVGFRANRSQEVRGSLTNTNCWTCEILVSPPF